MAALGNAPEDEGGETPVPVPSAAEASTRVAALAARVDAMLADDEDDGSGGDKAQAKGSEVDKAIDAEADAGETSIDAPIDVADLEEVSESHAIPVPPMVPPPASPHPSGGSPVVSIPPRVDAEVRKTQAFRAPMPPPPLPPRPVVVVPPRPPVEKQTLAKIPLISKPMRTGGIIERPTPTPVAITPSVRLPEPLTPPAAKLDAAVGTPVPDAIDDDAPRTRRPSSVPPPPPPEPERARRPSEQQQPPPTPASSGALEVGTATPNIVTDQPREARLEHPTALDRALAELGDAGVEQRAEQMARQLDGITDSAQAAFLAYELGELCERQLADEARAVKAFGRALTLDPSLRPNLWAIRRVFYRRGLWPNLAKLIDAEVAYAHDDHERADLFLEKARVLAHNNDPDDARLALDEAVRIAPAHQAALLELERVVAKAGDVPALLDVWEKLAHAVEMPARKVGYWLEVARAAAGRDLPRAHAALDFAGQNAQGAAAERVARERLRVAEEHGTPDDVAGGIEALLAILMATCGPAGPSTEGSTERATTLRHEMVALRRRQAQLARMSDPNKAWEQLQQALALAPGEPLLLADLTELAEELGRYDDLAELVQSWQAVEGDPGRALVLSVRRADALLRGGQRDEARALLASLEATAPGFVVLTSAAERDAIARADAAELAKTYTVAGTAALLGTWVGPGQLPAPDPGAAAALYVQAAELTAYEAGGADGHVEAARELLGKALEAVPSYAPALEALTELDDTAGQVASALARLRTVASVADPDEKRAVLERGIRLARSHGDLDSVLELEHQLVDMAPGDTAIKWRLEATLAQLGKDEDRAALLESIAKVETDATRRGTALLAAARLRERGGAVEAATELYRQVLGLWPEDTFARESLIDLLRAQEKWTELVTERRTEARGLPDGPAARRADREATWVLEVRLGTQTDLASAAVVYEEWLGRLHDDRAALEGLARCRGAQGDRLGEVSARATIAELEPTAETQWLHARALERASHFDEAAEQYRHILARNMPSVAGTAAALALSDLAASRADTMMRVEATTALASRTTDTGLGAALAEDSGWMYALVLEDFDHAAGSFEAAIALDPTRRGALLGAALVAARRGEHAQQAKAYEGLAMNVEMAEAAAALHLRAAAMAAQNGDLELANTRVSAARAAAPDDSSALLVVAETSTLPTASDLEPLLARAEVLEMRAALADDPAARAGWDLDRAEALELAGRLREAGKVVAGVLAGSPTDLRALVALRRMADRAGDKPTWANASYQLAKVIGDRHAKLSFLRDAASVYDVPNGNPELATAIYRRILAVDAGAPEHERLLAILRERADIRGLTVAITDRLTYLEARLVDEPDDAHAAEALVPLLLERATVLLGLGDSGAAMADLDALLQRAPANVEALRFRADLAINAGDAEGAVALWRRYLAAETRPKRRAEVELQLAGVLAENVNDVAGAIEQLARVIENAGPDSPDAVALLERMLGLCLRAADWPRAVKTLEALDKLRPTPQEKAREELRLGLMQRDRLGDRAGARKTLERARALDPLNLDIVRDLLDLLEPQPRAHMLATSAESLRQSLAQTPGRAPLYERLAQVTAWQSDVDARWLALVAVEALGTPSVDQRQVLAQGRQKIGAPGRGKLDPATRALIRGPLTGPLGELWTQIAASVQTATGVDAAKLGFARGDKLAIKKLGDRYEPLASALACFGVEVVEIYISAQRTGFARALAGDTPILCLGADVAAAATPPHRFQLGRAVATIAEGLAPIDDLRDGELNWTIAAALRAADAPVPGPLLDLVANEDKSVAERAKALRLGRKQRAVLLQLGQQQGKAIADIPGFRNAALAVGKRAGLVWSGDLAVALAQLDVGKGGRAIADSPLALELVAWSVSEDHMKLRERLGLALKGTRA